MHTQDNKEAKPSLDPLTKKDKTLDRILTAIFILVAALGLVADKIIHLK